MEQGKVKKLGVGATTAVFVAYTCSVSTVPNGAIVGESTTFVNGLLGIILAFVVSSFLAASVSWITYKTGTIKDVVWHSMFGRHGFRVCSLMFAFCQSFWACFDFFNAGQALYNLMPEGSPLKHFGFCIAVCILLVLTIIGGVKGITGVAWISAITIPIAVVLFAIIFGASFREAGGIVALTQYVPAGTPMSIPSVAQIMIGMWMAGYVGMMDLTSDAKNTKSIVIAAICSVAFIGLCFVVGQVGFIGTGMKTVGDLCLYLGGAIFVIGNLFVIFAQGNTTPACNLMYANSYSQAFNIKRTPIAIIVPVIVAVLAFVIMYGPGVDFINNITNTVSAVMSPLVGVTLVEFYLIRKKHLVIKPLNEYPAVYPAPMISLVIGFIISLAAPSFVSMPSVFVIVVTGVIHFILSKAFKTNKALPASDGT